MGLLQTQSTFGPPCCVASVREIGPRTLTAIHAFFTVSLRLNVAFTRWRASRNGVQLVSAFVLIALLQIDTTRVVT
jgi:hypothetical protein